MKGHRKRRTRIVRAVGSTDDVLIMTKLAQKEIGLEIRNINSFVDDSTLS